MFLKGIIKIFILVYAIISLLAAPSFASEEIRFVKVGWTGLSVKTWLAKQVLESIGYTVSIRNLSVPNVYKTLEEGNADVFLGYWVPSMLPVASESIKSGKVLQYIQNMPDAKYTLAVPSYAFERGLKDFSDIAQYADKLDHKIYGLEVGNDGNLIIQKMIDTNKFNLGHFSLITNSEELMLKKVKELIDKKKWVVFLGWSPYYMNKMLDMKYLTGSTEETFGRRNGTAIVYTNIRNGFAEEQPNVARFLKNLTFPIDMINQISLMLHNDKELNIEEAGVRYLKENPTFSKVWVYAWLKGVKTSDGEKAYPVFSKWLDDT